MTIDKTPTTAEIRDAYLLKSVAFDALGPDREARAKAEFDRWLAAYTETVMHAGWEEGFNAGELDVLDHEHNEWTNPCKYTNPYKGCEYCNDTGIVGGPPDNYMDCPQCSSDPDQHPDDMKDDRDR